MSNIIINKKKIQLFVVSTIAIALVVSSIASILVAELYDPNKTAFTIALLVSLVLIVLVSYELIASEDMNRNTSSKFVFAFDKVSKKFLDIKHHSPSVHARVGWEQLTLEHRNHLATLDHPSLYFGSDLNFFIDQVVQYYVVMIAIKNTGFRNSKYEAIPVTKFPRFLMAGRIFSMDNKAVINLPSSVSIERIDDGLPYIKLASKYGSMDIRWTNSFSQRASYTEPFILSQGINDTDHYHDFSVNIECTYKLKHWRMLSQKAKEFHEWVELVSCKIKDSSWDESEKHLELYLLSQLFVRSTLNKSIQPTANASAD